MRYAWPAKQCRWLGSGRYPFCRRVAVTNSNNITNTYTDTNGNGNAYRNGYADGDGNGYSFGATEPYGNSYSYGYVHDGTECYANSYFYCNNSSDSDGYSAADAQCPATSDTAVAAYATTKAVTEHYRESFCGIGAHENCRSRRRQRGLAVHSLKIPWCYGMVPLSCADGGIEIYAVPPNAPNASPARDLTLEKKTL